MGAKQEVSRLSLIVAAAIAAILLAPRSPPPSMDAPSMSVAQ
ncbi:hypothetical protein [Phenylobacterium sp.]|nr:hypothetical protein [Phenylobacterium sp.]